MAVVLGAWVRTGAALVPTAHVQERVGLWCQSLISVAKACVKPYEHKRLLKRLATNNKPLAERSWRWAQVCWPELSKRLRYKQLESSSSLVAMSKRLLKDLP